jgi:hypothetical protein
MAAPRSWRLVGVAAAMAEPWLPFFISYDQARDRLAAPAAVVPDHLAWVEVAGDAARLRDWVGTSSLPMRVVDGVPRPAGCRRCNGCIGDCDPVVNDPRRWVNAEAPDLPSLFARCRVAGSDPNAASRRSVVRFSRRSRARGPECYPRDYPMAASGAFGALACPTPRRSDCSCTSAADPASHVVPPRGSVDLARHDAAVVVSTDGSRSASPHADDRVMHRKGRALRRKCPGRLHLEGREYRRLCERRRASVWYASYRWRGWVIRTVELSDATRPDGR